MPFTRISHNAHVEKPTVQKEKRYPHVEKCQWKKDKVAKVDEDRDEFS